MHKTEQITEHKLGTDRLGKWGMMINKNGPS